jgi:metal-responsive CopG/Arc/MetJ family transcriptional regulator
MVRIQLDMPDEQVADLDGLMAETKVRTRKELFNNALTLFDWAVKQKKAGLVIAAINQSQGVVKEILMPALENVGASAREDVSEVGRKGAAGGRA